MELCDSLRYIGIADFRGKGAELIYFKNLNVRAKGDRNQGHVGHDVEHAAVIMAH